MSSRGLKILQMCETMKQNTTGNINGKDGMDMTARKPETTVASVLTDNPIHSDLNLKQSNQQFHSYTERFTDKFEEKSFLFSFSHDSDDDPNWIPTHSSSDSDSLELPRKRRNIQVAIPNPTELHLTVELEDEERNELTDEETIIKCRIERQKSKNSGKKHSTELFHRKKWLR